MISNKSFLIILVWVVMATAFFLSKLFNLHSNLFLNYSAFGNGEYWRGFTSSITHNGSRHLVGNLAGATLLMLLLPFSNSKLTFALIIFSISGNFSAYMAWKCNLLHLNATGVAGFSSACYGLFSLLALHHINCGKSFLGYSLYAALCYSMIYQLWFGESLFEGIKVVGYGHLGAAVTSFPVYFLFLRVQLPTRPQNAT